MHERQIEVCNLTMDFDEPSNKIVTREFLAVVLAGFGNEYDIMMLPQDCVTDAFRVGLYHSPATMETNHLRKPCFQSQTNRW